MADAGPAPVPGAVLRVTVAVFAPLRQCYDYRWEAPAEAAPTPAEGARVWVPFGRSHRVGIVIAVAALETEEAARLKAIDEVLDATPLLDAAMLTLARWSSGYYQHPLGDVLASLLPTRLRRREGLPDISQERWRLAPAGAAALPTLKANARRQRAVLELLAAGDADSARMATLDFAWREVVRRLVARGEVEHYRGEAAPAAREAPAVGVALNDEQQTAVDAVTASFDRFQPFVLDGVTGSGKTEVYLEAIARCLARGQRALVLVPEIALTQQLVARFRARFGERVGLLHSGLGERQRLLTWDACRRGRVGVLIGTRSAVWVGLPGLGLVVVDEEHDGSYKQQDGVLYNARDMAVLRGSLESAQVVLASATPSLETWANAEAGKYARLDLTARFGEAVMPSVNAVDMREEALPANRWISERLVGEIRARMAAGEQSLLFLNRRGYAPVTLCRACGHQIGCRHCDARLVEHRFQKRLVCHQCGETEPIPAACPNCNAEDKLAPVGPGVERLAEETAMLFPDAKLAVLSSDLFGSARALKEAITAIAEGGADIIIGTQIVAKGHNFPKLTLVGVIDADLGLQGSDLRAAERTFQLMRQVAGRAGRAEKPGVALLQTYQPAHPVIRAILGGDEEAFWRAEASERRGAGVPPYGRMAGIILSSPDVQEVFDFGLALSRADAPLRAIGAELYGPAPAPIARIRGRHRVRLLVKADKGAPIQAAIAKWLAQFKPPTNLRLSVDIDPQTFF